MGTERELIRILGLCGSIGQAIKEKFDLLVTVDVQVEHKYHASLIG